MCCRVPIREQFNVHYFLFRLPTNDDDNDEENLLNFTANQTKMLPEVIYQRDRTFKTGHDFWLRKSIIQQHSMLQQFPKRYI